MEQTNAATRIAPPTWLRRENLVPGLALLVLTAIAWSYTLSQAGAMNDMTIAASPGGMSAAEPSTTNGAMTGMDRPAGRVETSGTVEPPGTAAKAGDVMLFLFGWAVMMIAMMLPAALPLILLYRTIARKRLQPAEAVVGMGALLIGYVGVWTVAGTPVYVYSRLTIMTSPLFALVPGLLLIVGGIYQFTALKRGCHTRCSNPLFFLMNKWKSGMTGAFRLGVLHGIDCLGCCVGLMVALVALGMMNVAWMLTTAVIIFIEKTLPGGHQVARPLGIMLVLGGIVVLGRSVSRALAM